MKPSPEIANHVVFCKCAHDIAVRGEEPVEIHLQVADFVLRPVQHLKQMLVATTT